MTGKIEYEYKAQILESLCIDLADSGPKITELWFKWVNCPKLAADALPNEDYVALDRDWTMKTLSGVIAWVGKQAQLCTKPVSLGDGRQLIAKAITEGYIKPRGPGHPHSLPPASMPFSFHSQDLSPWSANLPGTAKWWEVPQLGPQAGQQEWGQVPQWGQNWGQRQQEL